MKYFIVAVSAITLGLIILFVVPFTIPFFLGFGLAGMGLYLWEVFE